MKKISNLQTKYQMLKTLDRSFGTSCFQKVHSKAPLKESFFSKVASCRPVALLNYQPMACAC